MGCWESTLVLSYSWRNKGIPKEIWGNLLQKSIIIIQQNSAHFEEGIVCALQSAWKTFKEWQSCAPLFIQESFVALLSHFASLAPDNEWISFTAHSISWIQTCPFGTPRTFCIPPKLTPASYPFISAILRGKNSEPVAAAVRSARYMTESHCSMVSGWLLIAPIEPCNHGMVPSDDVGSLDAIQNHQLPWSSHAWMPHYSSCWQKSW